MIIASILAALGGLVASIGPLALLGGPLGLGLAWVGSLAANKTVKLVSIGVGIAIVVAVSVGLTVYVQHLERDRLAYRALSAAVVSLQSKYGCDLRPPHEHDLAACLTARERDAEAARTAEVSRLALVAAKAQADLALALAGTSGQRDAIDAFIDERAAAHDGPVPQVLLDTWARERADRGGK